MKEIMKMQEQLDFTPDTIYAFSDSKDHLEKLQRDLEKAGYSHIKDDSS